MANFRSALRTRAKNFAGLTDIVGDGIFWNAMPQGRAFPALVFQVVSDPRPNNFGGVDSARRSRVRIDAYSSVSASQAHAIAEAAIQALDGPAQVEGIEFQKAEFEGPEDSGLQEDGIYIHRARLYGFIWHGII